MTPMNCRPPASTPNYPALKIGVPPRLLQLNPRKSRGGLCTGDAHSQYRRGQVMRDALASDA
jgi:hypothetical protein